MITDLDGEEHMKVVELSSLLNALELLNIDYKIEGSIISVRNSDYDFSDGRNPTKTDIVWFET